MDSSCGFSAARAAFNTFDKKGEDRIKVGDIEFAMKKIGHSFKSEFLEKLEDIIDTEGQWPQMSSYTVGMGWCQRNPFYLSSAGTGYIDFEEFCTIVKRKMQEDEDERELREIFRVLDKDKKGEVNVSELRWERNNKCPKVAEYPP